MPDKAYSLESISSRLFSTTSLIHAPKKPRDARLTARIADLCLHPSLEALLHILNADLPSAHFLVRHMQAPPAVEGMLLHSVLHRVEGDLNNARAWMGDVMDACEGWVPKKRSAEQRLDDQVCEKMRGGKGNKESLIEYVYGREEPKTLIDDVERIREVKNQKMNEGKEGLIEEKTRVELRRISEWCREKFGDEEWVDASEAWVKNSEEIQKISNDMVSGNRGYRKF